MKFKNRKHSLKSIKIKLGNWVWCWASVTVTLGRRGRKIRRLKSVLDTWQTGHQCGLHDAQKQKQKWNSGYLFPFGEAKWLPTGRAPRIPEGKLLIFHILTCLVSSCGYGRWGHYLTVYWWLAHFKQLTLYYSDKRYVDKLMELSTIIKGEWVAGATAQLLKSHTALPEDPS